MGSKALILLRGASLCSSPNPQIFLSHCRSSFQRVVIHSKRVRSCSTKMATRASLQPPDVTRLAETARISLTSGEVEEFAPKVRQVVDWFGQLQDVDLQSIEPSVRADTEGDNLRDDVPETFENRDAMISAVPLFDERYIKVPKVLNKE